MAQPPQVHHVGRRRGKLQDFFAIDTGQSKPLNRKDAKDAKNKHAQINLPVSGTTYLVLQPIIKLKKQPFTQYMQ